MQLICASCSGLAPAKKQWFNQDTGYGICPRCWSKVLGRELIVRGPIEGLTWALKCYGLPGKHHSTDQKPNIFHAVLSSGTPYASHETDLYIPVNEKTRKLIEDYEFKSNVTTFTNQVEGGIWYDIPFAYLPAWDCKQQLPLAS